MKRAVGHTGFAVGPQAPHREAARGQSTLAQIFAHPWVRGWLAPFALGGCANWIRGRRAYARGSPFTFMRLKITVPDAIAQELQAAAASCHISANEWASEAIHSVLATRRLCQQVPVMTNARVPGTPKTTPEPAAAAEVLDTLAALGPDTSDLAALENIS
jgi:hypothetical protein